LEPGTVSSADLLEGALAIGDHAEAVTILGGMSDAEREQPAVLRLRLALAEATGRAEIAEDLRRKLGSSD
jgi:hypothetical protein